MMRLSREEFREHLIDYLYGQLEATQRESFEACLAESADCRQELAELEQTLDHARSGLALLDEAPPARARQAVLALAAAPVTSAVVERPSSTSALARLIAWLANPVPLGALSVAAVAALGLLVHQSQHDEVHNAQPDRFQPTAPTAPMQEPGATGETGDVHEQSNATGTASELPASSGGAQPSAATPGPARDAADEPLPSKPSPSPARRETTPPRPSTRPARAPAKATEAVESRRAAGAAQPATERREAERLEEDESASPVTPSTSRASRAREPSAASSSDAREPAPPAPAAPSPPSTSSASKGLGANSRAAPVTLETLQREANAHLAAHRLREAAESYEALLRRFPDDARAPQWRKQLALIQRALHESAPTH
jgi:hypothetical protein